MVVPSRLRRLPVLAAHASAAVIATSTVIAGSVALSGAIALVGAVSSASAAAFSPVVARGGLTVPAGARDLGRLRGSSELRLTIALRPRDARGLAAYAAAVSTPGSVDYHRYLSVTQFAARFAPTTAELDAVRARLRAHGLVLGATSPNGMSIAASGSAAVLADALGTPIDRYALRDGATEDVATGTPSFGSGAGSLVQGVVGLGPAPTASLRVSTAHRRGTQRRATGRPRSHSGQSAGPVPCSSASAQASETGGQTANEIAAHYGLANFWAAGDEGQGVTIALYELEPFSASDIAGYQACMGTNASVTTVPVDGGAGIGPGSGEAAADVEDLVGLAPKAQIDVYEGPATPAGAYDTYSAIVAADSAQVISTSWGLCEAQAGRPSVLAEALLFQEAAVQGQTVLAASGDNGSDDCGNGTLGVDDPGSDPWVTSVGGTHFAATSDTVWNGDGGASGGGASSFWARPAWQTSSVAQSVVTCGAAGTSCREVPDVSADADPATGYAAFYRGGWRTVGGTSVAAPTVAALAVLADASPACGGGRLGLINPALYADAADLRDVTVGTNSLDGVPGFSAGPGYDMASGLGTPTATLGPALCGDAVTFTAPPAQAWSAGHAVSLPLTATSLKGAALAWSATGLPAGLTLDPATGRISGTPTAAGSSTVTVTVLDADGATESATFTASVTAAAGATVGSSHRSTHGRARHHRRARVHHGRRTGHRGGHGRRHHRA